MENKKTMGWIVDPLFQLFCLIVFLLMFIVSFSLIETAAAVPRLICGAGVVLSALQLVVTYLQRRNKDVEPKEKEELKGIPLRRSLLLILIYVACLYLLGFAVSSFLAFTFMPMFIGYRNWKICLIYSTALTVALHIVFVNLFYVRLPVGLLLENLL